MMKSINRALAETLQTVRRPGDFYFSGRQEIFAPGIKVDGVGTIALPLLPGQAEELAAIAEPAPYGRGAETLVDPEVRRTWQIAPEQIEITGRHWVQDLTTIVSRCADGLGVEGDVRVEPYKMLLYDQGSFFVGHRDTEKVPGMFATLVIVLPSLYSGGELLIRHQEREVCLDLGSHDAAEVAFAAFYADCWHEVRPITGGCRLALIYNLIRPGRGKLPRPPAYDSEVGRIAGLLEGWRRALQQQPGEVPDKLIYPLEHVYTPAGLEFAALKNADAAAGAVLLKAAEQAQCELHLALVSIEEAGIAEGYAYRPRRGYRDDGDDDEDQYEIGEVTDRTLSLSALQAPDDSRPFLSGMPFDEQELCPPDAFEGAEPDEVQFFEATGNAGASFERSYRRAALVLWPREHKLALIAGAGTGVSLDYLAGQLDRWRQSGQDRSGASGPWREAHELARQIIARWPAETSWNSPRPHTSRLLDGLRQLEDQALILAFVDALPAQGNYGAADNPALLAVLALLPPTEAASAVQRIVTANALRSPAGCAGLLRMFVESRVAALQAAQTDALRAAAEVLFLALPGQPAWLEQASYQRARPTPELIADLLRALAPLADPLLGMRLVAHLCAQPDLFPMDNVLVPAALQLAESAAPLRAWPPIHELTAACVAHLARRIAEPLDAPADFARPSQLTCRCRQ